MAPGIKERGAEPSRRGVPDAGRAATALVREVLASPGRPLDARERAFLEPRFRHDFGEVRVHADAVSAASARAVGAAAFTAGRHIVFGAGRYAPGTPGGRRLLAHELAHVVQQAAGPVHGQAGPGGMRISDPSDRFEGQARQAAERLLAPQLPLGDMEPGRPVAPVAGALTLQRCGGAGCDCPADDRDGGSAAAPVLQLQGEEEAKKKPSVQPTDAGTKQAETKEGEAKESLPEGAGGEGKAAEPPPPPIPAGHTPAPPGMAACPDAPARNIVVLVCSSPPAKAPPPTEKATLPTVPTANFGGDADRIAFAANLAQCWAEREVKEEIEKRYRAEVAAAKKKATEESEAETKEAVGAAVEGVDPKDRRAVTKARDAATKTAKAAAAKKIADAQRAVTRQDAAKVTAELAKAHRDWLEADYAASITAALNVRFGATWRAHVQAVLNRERARITKAKTAKPKVKKGEEAPPAKTQAEIDAEIEAEMTDVRCDQDEWVRNQIEGVARAWAVGRREQVDFRTISQTAKYQKDFGPSYVPAEADKVPIPAAVRQGGASATYAPVAAEVADFLVELQRVLAAATPPQAFSATNRAGHGGGTWAGKGFSLDLYIPAKIDARGFWDRSAAISFLLTLDKVATSFGARWRVLYNDFGVAQAVNKATGSLNVVFVGEIDKGGNLNWHGPDPLILHFHLDLEIPKGAKPPAPKTP